MNFLLSPEQLEMQRTVSRFAADQCDSVRLHRIFDSDSGHDAALWSGLMALGLGGICIGSDYGGSGLEMVDLAIVAETLGQHAFPGPFLGHSLAGLAISMAGSEAQKARWLPALASGDCTGSIALSEGDAGWQPEDWHMTPGETISGAKYFVPGGEHAGLLVAGLSGGGLAVIEKSAHGLQSEARDTVDRTRRTVTLTFDQTPAEALADGAACSGKLRDAALVLLAADAFGGALRCVDMAVAYAKTREQFGQPIAHFQALKHQLANMAADIEPARGLYWYAAHAWDHIPAQRARSAALAKAHLTDRYLQVARDAVEAHGGIGYTWEHDLQIWVKRAMFDFAWMGTPASHRRRAAQLAGW